MRRQEIQLLAAARQGDVAARFEAGRRYLLGCEGFRRHPSTALDYLTHSSVVELAQAAILIAQHLSLDELLSFGQQKALRRAAAGKCVAAQVKLAAWQLVRHGDAGDGLAWLSAAAGGADRGAVRALAALGKHRIEEKVADVLLALFSDDKAVALALIARAAREVLMEHDLAGLRRCLRAAIGVAGRPADPFVGLTVDAVHLAEQTAGSLEGIPVAWIETSLEASCGHGHQRAAYVLGRSLCGIPCGSLHAAGLVEHSNMRKGAALLLRAADGGFDEAWLHLFRLHSDNRSSVSNPTMARFFLEKAARHGFAEAQRKLGALLLREANTIGESEQAIEWLFRAAGAADLFARQLLETLVLPLAGTDAQATAAIEEIQRHDPWLAVRLRLSRDFGLTKLEALTVDPVQGERAWGLVVGRNPFISQTRLSAPRAVPALSPAILIALRRAAAFFEQARGKAGSIEGDLRRRSLVQRRAFERHHLDEDMFFAKASSTVLDALRHGPKWAFRSRQPLQSALSA